MKGGLCVIYTSLLTISVLSSCALFILVVSEAHQADDAANVDLSGLHNVSHKGNPSKDAPKSAPGPDDLGPQLEDQKTVLTDHEMTFAETLSLNSVTTDGLLWTFFLFFSTVITPSEER